MSIVSYAILSLEYVIQCIDNTRSVIRTLILPRHYFIIIIPIARTFILHDINWYSPVRYSGPWSFRDINLCPSGRELGP